MKDDTISQANPRIVKLCILSVLLLWASTANASTADLRSQWQDVSQSVSVSEMKLDVSMVLGGCIDGEIVYGQAIKGHVSTGSNSLRCYHFEGLAGDVITARLTRLDGNLDPFLELTGENGSLVSDDDGGGNRNSLIAQFRLPENGTYYLLASSYLGSTSGQFELKLEGSSNQQPGPNSLCSGTIVYGHSVSSQVPPGADCVFTFTGSPEEMIGVTIKRLAGTQGSHVDLVSPEGSLIAPLREQDSGLTKNYRLPQGGVYTIRVGAREYWGTLAFELVLWRMDACGGNVEFFEPVYAEISNMTPRCYYTFYSPGASYTMSTIWVQVVKTTGNLKPKFQVFGPDDVAVSGVTDYWQGRPSQGTYTIIALGEAGTTGRFELNVTSDYSPFRARLAIGCGQRIESGRVISYNLNLNGSRCVYTFEGKAGNTVTILLTGADDDLDPYLSLYCGDNKSPEAWDDDGAGERNSMIGGHRLMHSGTYRIVVSSYEGASKGRFYLSLWVVR
jgi:hypothetical protein